MGFVIFPYIGNVIIPTDEVLIFQRGWSTTNSSPWGYFHSWILTCQHKDSLFCGMKWIILPFARDAYDTMMSIPHWWWTRFGLIGLVHSLAGVVGTCRYTGLRSDKQKDAAHGSEICKGVRLVLTHWWLNWCDVSIELDQWISRTTWISSMEFDWYSSMFESWSDQHWWKRQQHMPTRSGRRNSHSGLRQQASPLPWYKPVCKGTTPYINPISMFFYMSRS